MPTETLTCDSEILRRVDLDLILEELIVFLRNNLTDRRSRTTSETDTFTGTGSASTFTFTKGLDSESRFKGMNVKSVTVAGTAKTFYTDYVVGYQKESDIAGKIQFWVPPANSASISVVLEHTYSWIYSERPRIDLTSRSYPRVSVGIKGKPVEAALGGKCTRWEISIALTIIDIKRNQVESTLNEVQRLFTEKATQQGFKNFNWIYIDNVSDIVPSSEDENDNVYGVEVQLLMPFEYQYSK